MRLKRLIVGVLVFIILAAVLINSNLHNNTKAQIGLDVYVGVDIAYGNVTSAKELADQVCSYTNLFILGCTGITNNTVKLEEACQYLYDKGLAFIIYQEVPIGVNWTSFTASNWTETAKNRWGNKFLGFYYGDEFGGKQLDLSSWSSITKADSYEDIGKQYTERISNYNHWFKLGYSNWTDLSLYTSDYALYWFDYKAGYDTVFAEFGWNYSRQLNAALCRGAATIQDKEWGVIIAWTYTEPPYIESGEELYNDLILAYDNGAKYIVIFDSNEQYTQSILTQEHFNALEKFWSYIQDNPRKDNSVETRTAVVLPENYAYGFRGPEDKIWGLWEADNISYALSVGINNLLEQYGTKLDIIYDDNLEPDNKYGYSNFIYWNDTSKFPAITSTPRLAITPNQTASLNPTITPSHQPSTAQPQKNQNTSADYIFVLVLSAAIVTTIIVTALFRKKYLH
jgi:hypothetical protein